jgi:hypothetical protein
VGRGVVRIIITAGCMHVLRKFLSVRSADAILDSSMDLDFLLNQHTESCFVILHNSIILVIHGKISDITVLKYVKQAIYVI